MTLSGNTPCHPGKRRGSRRCDEGAGRPVVIVTGADSGIGYGLTVALLGQQYRVAAIDVALDELAEPGGRFPEFLRLYRCDVTQADEVRETVNAIIREWGRIDVLFNNACLALFRRFEEKAVQDTRREFEVNYFGYVHMITAVLPHMKSQGGGVIHNVSSGVGLTGFPGLSGYASTKGAIEALSRTLAMELAGDGVAVSVVHPPLTATKSAAPLGLPPQAMADPASIGRSLARHIVSRKAVVTPDWRTGFWVCLARCFPVTMGKLMSALAAKSRAGRQNE